MKNLPADFSEHKFHTGEIHLNYAEGPENGPPLVLIPGQAVSWRNYDPVLGLLSEKFHVFAVDVRGHGKSDWTPGQYTFNNIGADMSAFLRSVVRQPAYLSGNSSGGLISLWLAANQPDWVKAIVLEDPPLFSAEWPRIKKEHVYSVLAGLVEIIEAINQSDDIETLSAALRKVERPLEGTSRTRKFPGWLTSLLARIIRNNQKRGQLNQIPWYLPGKFKLLFEILTTFDPDFSRAWLDGRIYEGLNHEDALKRTTCPTLLLHADWFRHEKFGLVGAMDDDDANHARSLLPSLAYKRVRSPHVMHSALPEAFAREVTGFFLL
jgi:pimeloyl-ACP methyl ester carboxylesterase